MTVNPFIKRLLGEAVDEVPPPEQAMPAEPAPPEDQAGQEPAAPPQQPTQAGGLMQQLAKQWQTGDHMAVAAKLMFTDSSYADFVDLVFAIGQEDGRELGQLLDELADSGASVEPSSPPQYQNLLKRVAGAHEEEGVI